MGRINTVLVDTSVIIDYLRVKNKDLTPYSQAINAQMTPTIPLVVYSELYSGTSVWKKKEAKTELEDLLEGIEVIIPGKGIAKEAGRLKAEYNVELFDAFIAATALDQHLPLFTLNKSHFAKIPSLTFYTLTKTN